MLCFYALVHAVHFTQPALAIF